MLCNPRPDASQTAQVHDWGEHDTLNSQLLDAMQQGLAFRTVPLRCLLFEELIDIRIATVGIKPITGTCSLPSARRSISSSPRLPLVLLLYARCEQYLHHLPVHAPRVFLQFSIRAR